MSLYLRHAAQLLSQASEDEPRLSAFQITRVEFSPGDGTCYIYGVCAGGEEAFGSLLDVLKLYGPSLRKGLAQHVQGRHVPHVVFAYDTKLEKEVHLQQLLDEIKKSDL